MSRVVVVGSYNVGLTVVADRLPGPGETVLGHTFDIGPGGKGSNQAIGARRLGADVTLVCKLGDDTFAEQARELFAIEGLEGSGILAADTHTGVGLIMVDDRGGNMISVAPGANAALLPDDLDLVSGLFEDAGFMMCQLEAPPELFVAAAGRARAAGATTVLNPAPAVPLTDEVFPLIDIMTPNESELTTLTGMPARGHIEVAMAARDLLAKGVGEVIVTMGSAGGVRVTASAVEPYDAYEVDAVDTTGAGDAFNAGLVAGLASGLDGRDAIRLGARAGAFCATRVGVVAGLPTLEQLDAEVPA